MVTGGPPAFMLNVRRVPGDPPMNAPYRDVKLQRTVAVPPVGAAPPKRPVVLEPAVMEYVMSTWTAAAEPGIAAMKTTVSRESRRERM